MTTISVTNRKGGVGKSSMSLHIATGLATVGYRVGLIDTDSQGHIDVSLGIEPSDALYEVLVEAKPLDDTTFRVIDPDKYSTPDNRARGSLRVLSSSDNTFRIARELGEYNVFALLNLIDRMKREFDLHYVIIDTSPTFKELDVYVYMATDAFVYVTEVEALAMHGLDKAIGQMMVSAQSRQDQMRRPTTVLGIIPNKKRGTVIHDTKLEELEQKFPGFVWSAVRLNTLWAEASAMTQVLFRYAPSSEAATEAWQVVKDVLKAVQEWQTTNATR